MENFIKNIDAITTHMYKNECKHYEETYDVEINTNTEPTENHIFTNVFNADKFLRREVTVYNRKTNILNILKAITDDQLYNILETQAEQLAQEGKL